MPSLPADEEAEQRDTEAHHERAHWREQRTEAEAALKVDAGRYENTVGDKGTMNPAEAEGERSYEPRDGSKEGAVVEPFRHRESVITKEH